MEVKRGNYKTFSILVKDSDGDAVTDLATAIEILFQVKKNKTDLDADAIISVALADMTVDSPSTGYISIPLLTADTLVDVGTYFAGLQINYSASAKIEIALYEDGRETGAFTVLQDTVRG